MINSIRHFVEKETYEIEKTMREFVEGTIDIDSYGKSPHDRSLKLAQSILIETLETMDQTIKNSANRLESYVVEQSSQQKEPLLPLGSIRFSRTCYTSKTTGKSVYLMDEAIGLEGHQRMTLGAAAAILEETIESSYRKGGEHASLADHVAAQFFEKKGELKRDENGRKSNTLMPKLICVYEDIEEESGEKSKNKRYRLTGKHYFCGLYPGKENEKLWEEVSEYIGATYDLEYLEKIYIAGDGAAWIKAGCEVLEKAHFVLDKFHMEKYIQRSVVHLLDSVLSVTLPDPNFLHLMQIKKSTGKTILMHSATDCFIQYPFVLS